MHAHACGSDCKRPEYQPVLLLALLLSKKNGARAKGIENNSSKRGATSSSLCICTNACVRVIAVGAEFCNQRASHAKAEYIAVQYQSQNGTRTVCLCELCREMVGDRCVVATTTSFDFFPRAAVVQTDAQRREEDCTRVDMTEKTTMRTANVCAFNVSGLGVENGVTIAQRESALHLSAACATALFDDVASSLATTSFGIFCRRMAFSASRMTS